MAYFAFADLFEAEEYKLDQYTKHRRSSREWLTVKDSPKTGSSGLTDVSRHLPHLTGLPERL